MFNLDPGKLLVIAVVAIILLGPDRLPQVARQVGAAWRSFNEFRHRMETEVRSSMPDLPSTSEIARLARSPSALLNHLSTMSENTEEEPADDGAGAEAGTGAGAGGDAVAPEDTVAANGAEVNGAEATSGNGSHAGVADNGAASSAVAASGAATASEATAPPAPATPAASPLPPAPVPPMPETVVPVDPSLN